MATQNNAIAADVIGSGLVTPDTGLTTLNAALTARTPPAEISGAEITDGTQTALRSVSPADLVALAQAWSVTVDNREEVLAELQRASRAEVTIGSTPVTLAVLTHCGLDIRATVAGITVVIADTTLFYYRAPTRIKAPQGTVTVSVSGSQTLNGSTASVVIPQYWQGVLERVDTNAYTLWVVPPGLAAPSANATLTGSTGYDRLIPAGSSAADPTSLDWTATKDILTWTFTANRTITSTNVPTTAGYIKTIYASAASGGPHTPTFTGGTISPVGDTISVPASGTAAIVLETLGAGAFAVRQHVAGTDVTAATTSARGTVELATDGENAANVVVQGNDKRLSESIVIAASDETTALTAGTGKVAFRMPYAFTLTAVRASLSTAQASGNIFTVDINEGGTTILSTKLTIDNTEKTSTTAATAAVISDAALADDAEVTVDIDQIGDGTAKGLKVAMIGYRT
jgi:hypothetical protein